MWPLSDLLSITNIIPAKKKKINKKKLHRVHHPNTLYFSLYCSRDNSPIQNVLIPVVIWHRYLLHPVLIRRTWKETRGRRTEMQPIPAPKTKETATLHLQPKTVQVLQLVPISISPCVHAHREVRGQNCQLLFPLSVPFNLA